MDELVGTRQRYRLLDIDRVLPWLGGDLLREAFIDQYRRANENAS